MAVSLPGCCGRPLFILVLFSCVSIVQAQPVAKYNFSRYDAPVRQMMAANRSQNIAYNTLAELCSSIGHRLTGTANGTKAEEFMYKKARKLGYHPKYQPFMVPTWQRQYVELEVVPSNSDHYVKYEAVSLAHSPLDAQINTKMVDAGNGLAADFSRLGTEAVKGKVVLANIGLDGAANGTPNLHRSEKTALAIQYGASGVIFINSAPGRILLTGTASVDGGLIPIPALCIGNDAGQALRKWMGEESLQAVIRMENTFEEHRARNVTATLKADNPTKETIVIGAHLDSWDLATGAVDNGIGSAVVYEMARLLKLSGAKLSRNVEFVWFMAEEQGLIGSQHYVNLKRKRRELTGVKYMLNFDMSGGCQGWNASGFPKALEFYAAYNKWYGLLDTATRFTTENSPELHSDHQPFMLQGIPTAKPQARMPAKVYQCYHADCDHFKLVEPEYINETARAAAALALILATEKDLPAQPLTDEQTRQFLIKANLKEPLKIAKQWRWAD